MKKNYVIKPIFIFQIVSIFIYFFLSMTINIEGREFRNGWYHWPPFQYENTIYEQTFISGLDVDLANLIFGLSGNTISTKKISWANHQKELKTGELDIALGSFKTSEREQFAYFSDPYRTEVNVIYFRKGVKPSQILDSGTSIINYIKKNNLKVGFIKGYSYASKEINSFISNVDNQSFIIYSNTDKKNLYSLTLKKVDLIIIDQLSAATLKEKLKLNTQVYEYKKYKEESLIYAMFSKKTTSEEDVQKFNYGLALSKKTGQYNEVFRNYLTPVILNNFIHQNWFFILEIFGTVAFAISGIILAKKENYNIFGAFVLASLPSLGGGVIRDICVNRHPISIIRSPVYVYIVIVAVITCFILYRISSFLSIYLKKYLSKKYNIEQKQDVSKKIKKNSKKENQRFSNMLLEICDAIGIATFTLTGAGIAMEYRLSPNFIWIPIIACITGAGGGILRDIVRSEKNISTFKFSYYAQITLVWGFIFVICIENSMPDTLPIFILTTMLGVFCTRMAVIYFKIKSVKL